MSLMLIVCFGGNSSLPQLAACRINLGCEKLLYICSMCSISRTIYLCRMYIL